VDSAYPFTTKSILERIRGYAEGIKAAGLPVDDALLWVQEPAVPAEPDAAIAFLCQALRSHPDVTAVIAISLYDAQRVYEAASRLNRRISDDLSLIGFDLGGQFLGFNWLCAKGGEENPVAWIDQSEHTIGIEAARLVCRLTTDASSTEAIQVPAVLRPGATCTEHRGYS
jgi:DNA-binding LacI/PurR family transcriptional regulator